MNKFTRIVIPVLIMTCIPVLIMLLSIHNKNTVAVSYERLSKEEITVINSGKEPWQKATIYDKGKLLLTYHGPDSCSGGIESVEIKGDSLIVETTQADDKCGGAAGSIGGPYHRVINIPKDFSSNKNAKVVLMTFSKPNEIPITVDYRETPPVGDSTL